MRVSVSTKSVNYSCFGMRVKLAGNNLCLLSLWTGSQRVIVAPSHSSNWQHDKSTQLKDTASGCSKTHGESSPLWPFHKTHGLKKPLTHSFLLSPKDSPGLLLMQSILLPINLVGKKVHSMRTMNLKGRKQFIQNSFWTARCSLNGNTEFLNLTHFFPLVHTALVTCLVQPVLCETEQKKSLLHSYFAYLLKWNFPGLGLKI